VGLEEGARLLIQLFSDIKSLDINGRHFTVQSKHITSRAYEIGVSDQLHEYEFLTPWMALNQKNYQQYLQLGPEEQTEKLNRILCSNMLSLFKGLNYFEDQTIRTKCKVLETPIQFKNQGMKGFKGHFITNVLLPDGIGLGKSVARGFGTVQQKN